MEEAGKATNRQQLMQEYGARARQCGLRIDVPADGAFNAEIAVVAEAPGEREVNMRMPLVGGSGKYLWDVLKKYGLTRQHVYVTNVIKRQVSMSAKADAKDEVKRDELDHWEQLLQWELGNLPNLKYVIILGNYALRALTGNSGIMNWRGTVFDDIMVGGVRLKGLATFNPAYPLREPRMDVVFRMDIGKLEKLRDGTWIKPEINTHINPSYDEAMRWIDKMHDEGISGKPVGGDIEVVSGETACIGLANDTKTAMCISLRDRNSNRFSLGEERALYRRFNQLFSDTRVPFVFQNGMFDSYFLWLKDRIRIRRIWFDTMLAHHTLYPQLPHNLGFLTSQYTDHPFYKDEGKDWQEGGEIDDFWRYNGKDCCIMLECQQKILKELVHFKMDKFFFEHVMRIQPFLVEMTVGGVKVDLTLKERITDELREIVAKQTEVFHSWVHEATGDPTYFPNPASWKQLQVLFFNRLKLVGRGLSTAEENRKRMADHPRTSLAAKRMLVELDKLKEEDKFLTTYAESRVSADGRMRCEYKQTGTINAPGRLSSTQLIWGEGSNLQNQPSRAQPMFIADEGYSFGYFDLSQAEARVVAWEAEIGKWKEQFEKARLQGGYDCHRALASDMFGVAYDDVPSQDEDERGQKTIRYIAKRCRHGLNYRMAPERLATTTGMSLMDAQRNYNIYHRITPELKVWWDKLTKEVIETRTLYNAYGRRLIIMERIDEDSLNSIVAFKPQSTIGDKINRVIYLSREDPEWPLHGDIWTPAARPLLNIHDALICLAPTDKIQKCMQIMVKHAQEPIMIKGEPLIIPADVKISQPDEHGVHRWSTLKKVVLE